ncbi:MAG: aminodeoxychorismate synthase component I, partial [Salibacteraceae bacterium]
MDHLLAWSQDFERVSFLDSSRHPTSGLSDQFHSLVALGAKRELTAQTGNAFQQLKAFQQAEKDWLFGFLGYDLKNEVENLHSHHPDGVELPDLHFFQPEHVIRVSSNRVEVATLGTSPESVYQAVLRAAPLATAPPNPPLQLKARIPKAAYLHTIGKLKAHIRQGDIYEVNFCQEFFAANASLNPYATFQRL